MGQEAAQLAQRILSGEDASQIPIVVSDSMQPMFDWRQLRRWGISESRLPSGSEVRFRSPTVWQQYRLHILGVCGALMLQGGLITWLLYEHQRRRRSEAAAHELSGRLIRAQEEERSRLARELHDDVTQRLALLAIDAGREERRLPSTGGGAVMRKLREGLARLSEDVHALSYRLHPSILEDLGLTEALKSECERFSRTSSIRLDVNVSESAERVPHDVALCLFRIAQEGLRNIARHAEASRADIRIQRVDGGLELSVRDDGTGFDAARRRTGTSLGHASMRQRVHLLGGKVKITSNPGQGTTVLAWVPFREKRSEPSARVAG
jgi:signal transduction histidine kinase